MSCKIYKFDELPKPIKERITEVMSSGSASPYVKMGKGDGHLSWMLKNLGNGSWEAVYGEEKIDCLCRIQVARDGKKP